MLLAIAFGVSLGLCGLTVAAANAGMSRWGNFLGIAAMIEGIAVLLSFLALVATLILWALASLFGKESGSDPGIQKLFDDDQEK
ncbi:MAG TPA: hypothetical protein VHX60_05105 [Acidobacteriaceae bacterium]|nr:hypothetical protein [Acidobacteriaceae bacterium]